MPVQGADRGLIKSHRKCRYLDQNFRWVALKEKFPVGSVGRRTGTADWKWSTDFPVGTSGTWTGSSNREKELQADSSQSELPIYIPELPTGDDHNTRNLAEFGVSTKRRFLRILTTSCQFVVSQQASLHNNGHILTSFDPTIKESIKF